MSVGRPFGVAVARASGCKPSLWAVCVVPGATESASKKTPRAEPLLKELLRDATADDTMGGLR